jgi:hypothetical protein
MAPKLTSVSVALMLIERLSTDSGGRTSLAPERASRHGRALWAYSVRPLTHDFLTLSLRLLSGSPCVPIPVESKCNKGA